MTRVSTAASIPPFAAPSSILWEPRSSDPTDSHPAARKSERRKEHLPRASRLSKPRGPVKVHELHEKPVHFQGLHIAARRQAAPIAALADGCSVYFQRLRFTDFVSKAVRRRASAGMPSAISTSSHPTSSASLQDTMASCGLFLFVGAADGAALLVRLVTPFAERVGSALRRDQLLVLLCREEVGSFQTFLPCR